MNIVQAECINKINNTITIQITVESLYPDTVIEVAEYYNDTQLTDWINVGSLSSITQTVIYTLTHNGANSICVQLFSNSPLCVDGSGSESGVSGSQSGESGTECDCCKISWNPDCVPKNLCPCYIDDGKLPESPPSCDTIFISKSITLNDNLFLYDEDSDSWIQNNNPSNKMVVVFGQYKFTINGEDIVLQPRARYRQAYDDYIVVDFDTVKPSCNDTCCTTELNVISDFIFGPYSGVIKSGSWSDPNSDAYLMFVCSMGYPTDCDGVGCPNLNDESVGVEFYDSSLNLWKGRKCITIPDYDSPSGPTCARTPLSSIILKNCASGEEMTMLMTVRSFSLSYQSSCRQPEPCPPTVPCPPEVELDIFPSYPVIDDSCCVGGGRPIDIDIRCDGTIRPQDSNFPPGTTSYTLWYSASSYSGVFPVIGGLAYDTSTAGGAVVRIHTDNNTGNMRQWVCKNLRFITVIDMETFPTEGSYSNNWPYNDLYWESTCTGYGDDHPGDIPINLVPC